MPKYLVLFSFTSQGVEKIKDSPARVASAKETIGRLGGTVEAFYAILGSTHDTMFIVNAPSDEKLAQMVLSIARLGNVRTETHRLFDEKEFGQIIAGLS